MDGMFLGIDLEKSVVHNAAKPKYREPMGALKTDSRVTLRLSVHDIWFESVNLTLLIGNSSFDHAMKFTDGVWTATFCVPDFPCVVWYYFSLRSGDTHLYYGRNFGCAPCLGKIYWEKPPAFQLTVYDKEFTVPAWMHKSVMYQIFPDRFAAGDPENKRRGEKYHTSMGRRVLLHDKWDELPLYKPLPGKEDYEPCDYFGGDIRGIINNLGYLKELGVNLIYLNPVFEAASNHRYNTADYAKVDPFLGTNEDLKELFHKAGKMEMRVLLDGVFSHTGADSVYFNKYERYKEKGAYQGEDSPYFNWYVFSEFPDEYKSWWGFKSLPEVNEFDPGWIHTVIEGKDSVMKKWLRAGAAGFRLDVADELPDKTIEHMREAARSVSKDKVLLGEVWEDATTKQSYGKNRTYALGRALDSVMNYPLRNELVDFLSGRKNAFAFKDFLVGQSLNYPAPMYFSLMNLLSTHDIERIHTALAAGIKTTDLTREQQAHFIVLPDQKERADRLQKLAAAVQFSLPGIPSIYYGDEVAMDGLKDPFNRETFRAGDEKMRLFYRKIAGLRKESDVLKTGAYSYFAVSGDVIGILRFVADGRDMFDVSCENGVYLTVVNRSAHAAHFAYDFMEQKECVDAQKMQALKTMELTRADCRVSGKAYAISKGIVSGEIPAQGVAVIQFN
jgi:glycosidase